MHHTLLPNLDALLAPVLLSQLGSVPVSAVDCTPLQAAFAKSGSRILYVHTNGGTGPRFVLKRVSAEWDWLMRVTDDLHCRSVTLWQHGLLDQLPASIEHGVLACARDGAGWAILMRDLSDSMLTNIHFSPAANQATLAAMAAMHATFFDAPVLNDPALGLCDLGHVYGVFSPHTGQRETADEIPRLIVQGWQQLPALLEPDVAQLVLQLAHDPAPLCAALRRYPQTLIHGDWRHANQGLLAGTPPRAVLLDWQLAAQGPPAVELGRYLGANSPLLPGSKEQSLAYYRECLAQQLGTRFDDAWWQPQLALGLLGGFVQDGWSIGLKATTWHVGAAAREHWQADIGWWCAQVRAGAGWLPY